MAENCTRRSLQFQCPDPLSREATSRTTRYRIIKKRKAEENLCPDSDDLHDRPHSLWVSETQQNVEEQQDFDVLSDEMPFSDELPICEEVDEELDIADEDEAVVEDSSVQSDDAAGVVVSSCSLLVKQYSLRHNLTQAALADLLQLLRLYSPIPDAIPSSVYLFEKQFQLLNYPLNFHYFCSDCLQDLPTRQMSYCPNEVCKRPFDCIGAVSSFIEIPLELQLISLMQRGSCWEEITRRYDLRRGNGGNRSDIYDGTIYQHLFRSGFLSNKCNISLIINTDGVPVFRSSSFALWPILLLVNELPYRMRISRQNRLLGGLWYGKSKPDMTLFLKPMAETLLKLYSEGFKVSPPNTNQITCHVVLVACTCDLPARAQVMNMVQFNGFYGCPCCLQRGVTVMTVNRGRVHTFPFYADDPIGPQRNTEQHHEHVADAMASGSPAFGIKGPSWMETIPSFDLIKGMSFDYMHCVLLGVTRLLLRLWFTTSFHSQLWYLGNAVKEIDDLLCTITPPDEIKRTPRSIQSNLKYWKAHELRAWLMHYSPIVLRGFLPDDFYQHHLLLVEGIYLLLKDVVQKEDIIQSAKLLNHYCYLFAVLYEDRYMTLNVHGLLHLPECVNNLGPLWSHSCFPFEAANGDLLKLFHGSSGVEKQIIDHVATIQMLPIVGANSLEKGSKEEELYFHLSSEHTRRCCKVITPKFCAHGKPHAAVLTEEHLQLFAEASISVPTHHSVAMYSKIHLIAINRIIIAKPASRSSLRDNSGVVYVDGTGKTCYGQLQTLLLFENDQQQQQQHAFAVILRFLPASRKLCQDSLTNAMIDDHIATLCAPRKEDKCVIEIHSILDKCVLMDLTCKRENIFASLFPNSAEPE